MQKETTIRTVLKIRDVVWDRTIGFMDAVTRTPINIEQALKSVFGGMTPDEDCITFDLSAVAVDKEIEKFGSEENMVSLEEAFGE